jgi:hypothetical protein
MSVSEEISPKWLNGVDEARRHGRQPVGDLRLSNPIQGRVLDITVSGLGVETHAPVPVLMQSAFMISDGRRRSTIRGEVRWCRLTGTVPLPNGEIAPVFRAGIEILDSPLVALPLDRLG